MQFLQDKHSSTVVAIMAIAGLLLVQCIGEIATAPLQDVQQYQKMSREILRLKDNDEVAAVVLHHRQIRAALEGERSSRPKRSYGDGDDGTVAHKILVRQTDEVGTQGETDFGTDELVASLIRQRDQFISAAAVPEAPLPQQQMRRNLNSGL